MRAEGAAVGPLCDLSALSIGLNSSRRRARFSVAVGAPKAARTPQFPDETIARLELLSDNELSVVVSQLKALLLSERYSKDDAFKTIRAFCGLSKAFADVCNQERSWQAWSEELEARERSFWEENPENPYAEAGRWDQCKQLVYKRDGVRIGEAPHFESCLWLTFSYEDGRAWLPRHLQQDRFVIETPEELRELVDTLTVAAINGLDPGSVEVEGYGFAEAWRLGYVEEMSDLFDGFPEFDVPVGCWNVASVHTFDSVFRNCRNFNAFLGGWDMREAVDTSAMFANCVSFDRDLSGWEFKKLRYIDYMFRGCSAFRGGVSQWNVSSLSHMPHAFEECYKFNDDLSKWDVSNVTTMRCAFKDCYEFRGTGLRGWQTPRVSSFFATFFQCTAFNEDLSKWTVSQAHKLDFMFAGCVTFSAPLDKWRIPRAFSTSYMFYKCKAFDADLSGWGVSTVHNMKGMFARAASFTSNLEDWKIAPDAEIRGFVRATKMVDLPLIAGRTPADVKEDAFEKPPKAVAQFLSLL